MLAGARAHIQHMVGETHGLFVVLDHNDGVAQIAELRERVQQALVVARVQADAGFIEDIQHTTELRADLRGQTDTLRLTATETFGAAIERQIIEPNVHQKAKPLRDFLQDRSRNFCIQTLRLPRRTHRNATEEGE